MREANSRGEFDEDRRERSRTSERSDDGPSGKAARVSAMDGANIPPTSTM
jgi:hypothetical protein